MGTRLDTASLVAGASGGGGPEADRHHGAAGIKSRTELSRTGRQLTRAAVLVAAITLFSRVLGVVREALFAATFGANWQTDAFFVAFRIPDLIFNSLVGFLVATSFIPVFMASLEQGGRPGAFRLTRSVGTLLVFVLGAATILLIACVGPLVALIAPGLQRRPPGSRPTLHGSWLRSSSSAA